MIVTAETIGFVPGATVPTRFTFDTEAPLEVTVSFHSDGDFDSNEAVVWNFARSLLLDGLTDKIGSGDVIVSPNVDKETVTVHLSSPEGEQSIQYSAIDIESFVTDMYDAVTEDEEETIILVSLDLWVSRIQGEDA